MNDDDCKALKAALLEAEILTPVEQAAMDKWQMEWERFKKKAKAEGVDYTARNNKHLLVMLDEQVKRLAGDKRNASKDGEYLLSRAHELVKKRVRQVLSMPANGTWKA